MAGLLLELSQAHSRVYLTMVLSRISWIKLRITINHHMKLLRPTSPNTRLCSVLSSFGLGLGKTILFISAFPKEAREVLSVEIVIPELSGRRHRSWGSGRTWLGGRLTL